MVNINSLKENTGHETNQLLSEHVKITFNTFNTRLGSMNTLVIGGTGEGKSRYVVRPVVYSVPVDPRKITIKDEKGNKKEVNPKMSFVFTDPKGELCRDTAGFLKACGYKIKVFNLVNMEHSDCYNPFKYAKDDTAITILIDGLVDTSTGGGGKDPHWGNMAKALLNTCAFYMYYELPSSMQNFTTLSKLVPLLKLQSDEDTRAPFDDLLDIAIKNSPLGDLHPALVWRKKITATGGELSSIVSTAQAAVRLWADVSVQKMTEVDTLNLDTIGDTPTAVYVITPTTNSTYDFLVATFYNQLFEALMYKANMVYHGGLPHHVLVVQDEFANTGKIPDYDKKIATFRSCNISSIIIVQSPNQIKSMYEGKAQDIIDNTHIQVFLGNGGIGDESAPVWVSKALGKTTVKAESYSLNYEKMEIRPNVNSSIGSGERDLMTADEVRRLPADECIIMIKGYKPFRDKKIDLDKCLNYASPLFSNKTTKKIKVDGKIKEVTQWKLKKEFDYIIEKEKKTLNSFFEGKKELNAIDKKEYDELKKVLIRNSSFSAFENPYGVYKLETLKVNDILRKLCISENYYDDYDEFIISNKYLPAIYINNEKKCNKALCKKTQKSEEPINKDSANKNTRKVFKVEAQALGYVIEKNIAIKDNESVQSIEETTLLSEENVRKTKIGNYL